MNRIYDIIEELRKKDEIFAVCSIVSTKGSTPLKTGAKMIVLPDGSIRGTIGGGDLEKTVIENAVKIIAKKKAQLFHHNLLQQHGMCCGGAVDIFIEPVMTNSKLYIFGAGHVGKALARHAGNLDFDIFLIDDREEMFDASTADEVNRLPVSFDEILPTLQFDRNTFIVIATYAHDTDRRILSHCIRQEYAYLGMIGSKRKIEVTRKMFITGGIASQEEINKVDMPMGVDINAHSPDEIAISILAKLIAVKNK